MELGSITYLVYFLGGVIGLFIIGGFVTLIIYGINEIVRFHKKRMRSLNQNKNGNGNLNVQLIDQP
jgi:hypothetical protein